MRRSNTENVTMRSLYRFLRRLYNLVLDALFPRRCPFCHTLLFSNEPYECENCHKNLPYTNSSDICKGKYFAVCVSPLRYEGKVRDAMLDYKFHGKWYYAPIFGKHLADTVSREFSGCFDLVTWVPVSRRRLRSRGYDQSKLLTRYLCRELGIPFVRALKKCRHTPAQSLTENAEARRSNVSGAYSAVQAKYFRGKTVLLIDDIITTGSTLSECAGVLRAAGAKAVYCATVCKDILA